MVWSNMADRLRSCCRGNENKTNPADLCSEKETRSDIRGGGAMGSQRGGKTEEERLMLLQQRAQAEEETAKKKEELLTLFLEDKLQKEERNTEVNLLKLNEGWRSILRQSRAGELRGDVEVLSQTFERQRDVLDNVVKTLDGDLQGAELQWSQVRRVHLEQVERLCARQQQRVRVVQEQWERVLQELSSRFSSEREQVSSHVLQRRGDVEDASFSVEEQHQTAMEEIYRLYHSSILSQNSVDKKNQEAPQTYDTEEQKLKDREVKKVKKMKELKRVVHLTEEQKLQDLLEERQQLIDMNDEEVKTVKKMKETVTRLRDEVNKRETDNTSVERDVKDERKAAIRRNHVLQNQLTRDRAAARRRLTELTVQSDGATKRLKAAIAKGPKVLRVAEMCCKLERQLEDVLLIVPSEGTTGPETEGPDKDMSALQQVSMRINSSVLQREALRRRRDDLNRDNRRLRLLLRQSLDAMTVGDQDVGGRHALLTVGGAPTTEAPPTADRRYTERRYTVIEGVHAAKHAL